MQIFSNVVSNGHKKVGNKVKRFWRNEDGTATLEFVIWVPLFAVLMAFTTNIAMVFFRESELLRVVQDGNRSFSLGRLEDATAVQDYILSRTSSLSDNLTVATTISGGFVMSTLVVPASDFLPVSLGLSFFDGVNVNVSAQHIVEF